MPAPCPTTRPKATLAEVEAYLAPHVSKLKKGDQVICLVVRGYYRDTMGTKGKNDVGMYDDAFFWIAPHSFSSWNGNADPSRFGWNPNAGGYMARLRPGVYRFQKWKHRGRYWAFGQGPNPVSIDRVRADGTVAKTARGCFGINNHEGGVHGTSSEGCLTIPRAQWQDYRDQGYALLRRYGPNPATYPLILVERPDIMP